MLIRILPVFLGAICAAFAQNEPAPVVSIAPPAPRTAIEDFLARKDGIIAKEFHLLGRVAEIRAETLILSQPGKDGPRPRGLRILIIREPVPVGEKIALVDMDELDGLSRALNYMLNAIAEWQGSSRDYTEMVFSTRGDLQVGFTITSGKLQTFVRTGAPGSTVISMMDRDRISALRELIEQGREYLAAQRR